MNHIDRSEHEKTIAVQLPRVNSGEKTTVTYNGLLNNNGADKVYLHYGFDNWSNSKTVPMEKTTTGTFAAEVRVAGKDMMNFCFKDSADNWDNNNGSNWNVDIATR